MYVAYLFPSVPLTLPTARLHIGAVTPHCIPPFLLAFISLQYWLAGSLQCPSNWPKQPKCMAALTLTLMLHFTVALYC